MQEMCIASHNSLLLRETSAATPLAGKTLCATVLQFSFLGRCVKAPTRCNRQRHCSSQWAKLPRSCLACGNDGCLLAHCIEFDLFNRLGMPHTMRQCARLCICRGDQLHLHTCLGDPSVLGTGFNCLSPGHGVRLLASVAPFAHFWFN